MADVCGLVEAYILGAWVDITEYVRTNQGALETWHGRQTVLEEPPPSTLELVLDDSDHRFTPGNTGSPYYPDWDAGTPIRWSETVNATTVTHFVGVCEMPQTTELWEEDGDAEAYVTVSNVDILTQLDRATAFGSTLTTQITVAGRQTLKAHWPMNDAALPFASVVGDPLQTRTQTYPLNWGPATATTGEATVTPRGFPGPPGDDSSVVQYGMRTDTVGGLLRPALSMTTKAVLPSMPLPAGDVVTIVAWIYSDWPAIDSESTILTVLFTDPSVGAITLIRQDGATGTWLAEVGQSGKLTASVAGRTTASDRWTLVAIRYGFTPNLFELWVDGAVFAATVSGTAPTTCNLTEILMPDGRFAGALTQVQIHIGDAADWGAAEFAAQRRAGLDGFERQTVDERIELIAEYAGVDPANLDIERSPTLMQAARLNGLRPGAAMRAAAATDGGPLFSSRDGKVTFQSRTHRYYNPNVAPVEVPYSWLGSPLRLRRDRPLNSARVTQTGGSTAVLADAVSIARYQEGPYTATLETACDADPAVLAGFVVHSYASPRSRIEALYIDLDARTEAEQLVLLTLAIGDWIVTDAPSHWPEGAAVASIEGRRMRSDSSLRELTLHASPIVGTVPGEPGPWFRLGTSELGGTDTLPY